MKLSTAINPNDAHAIDVQYYKRCWAANVRNVLRTSTEESSKGQSIEAEVAADLEFVTLVERKLQDGEVLDTNVLQSVYESIRAANKVKNTGSSAGRSKTCFKMK